MHTVKVPAADEILHWLPALPSAEEQGVIGSEGG